MTLRSLRPAAVALLVLALAEPCGADDARALLEDSARRSGARTWTDRTLDVTIETRAQEGVMRVREARVSERRDEDGGNRTFVELVGPADVEGTLYLRLAPRGGEQQEWVFAPQARRPRRVAPGQTSEETASGADLGYRELEIVTRLAALPAADVDVTLAGDERLGDRACRVVRIAPRTGDAGSFEVWLGADDLLPYRIVPRDAGPDAPREILLAGYETIDGHATPLAVEVVWPDGIRRTAFRMRGVRYDVGLGDGAFSLARLHRGR